MRYQRLFITRGLPGSGKSTVARDMLTEHLTHLIETKSQALNLTLVSRDDFRRMFHGRRLGWARQEQLVTDAQDATIVALLLAKTDVFVHDTNLPDSAVARFDRIARAASARLEVIDLRDVPMAECIRRDAARTGAQRVGEAVIRKQFAEHIDKPGTATMTLNAAASVRATR